MVATSEAAEALGACLTVAEARGIATQLAAGEHVSTALREVHASRRTNVKELLNDAGIGHDHVDYSVAILSAIAGAKSVRQDVMPVWTMPGHEANAGRLTSEFHNAVAGARQAVTCATYNFTPKSQMWVALKRASERPGVVVTVYVDGERADGEQVKAQMPRAVIYRSASVQEVGQVVSHAKFVIIDHEVLLLTSANFSGPAENSNIEFGLIIHDAALASSIEATMTSKHGTLYELVG